MDENRAPRRLRGPPPPVAPAAARRLLKLMTEQSDTVQTLIINIATYLSSLSVCKSQCEPATIFFVLSALCLHGAIYCWFGDLSSTNTGGQPSVQLAAWMVSSGDSRWRHIGGGDEGTSSWLSSTSVLLPVAALFSYFIIYSTITICYRAIGDARSELFAACYFGVTVIHCYQQLLFLIVGTEAPKLLPVKTQFELLIWSAALALTMWVSSNSVPLYPSHPELVASDAAAVLMLVILSSRLLRSGITGAEETVSTKYLYHALSVNLIFRVTVLSSLPAELVPAVFLHGLFNVYALFGISQAAATASSKLDV